jgi:hypothetical protein
MGIKRATEYPQLAYAMQASVVRSSKCAMIVSGRGEEDDQRRPEMVPDAGFAGELDRQKL